MFLYNVHTQITLQRDSTPFLHYRVRTLAPFQLVRKGLLGSRTDLDRLPGPTGTNQRTPV